jgi:photosystem II stability/assembly factor-like uncharacterized protein
MELHARARRALFLIVVSILAMTGAGIAFAHPSLPTFGAGTAERPPAPRSDYQVAALDFVNPSTGWVVALFTSGDYAVLHTADGGHTWSQQLSGAAGPHAVYMKFFDPSNGLFSLVGTRPVLYRTFDGGHSWSSVAVLSWGVTVLSWSFVDPPHGWMLASPAELFRTQDGGKTWNDQGPPVTSPDQAFRVQFQTQFTGWLDTVSAGPYAYRSEDSGRSWARVALPAPAAGWPHSGEFFVAAHPTHQTGVALSVATFPPLTGRSGVGGTVVLYPPLTLRTFDGGVPVRYAYSVFTEELTNSVSVGQEHRPGPGVSQAPAPNQVELDSVDGGLSWDSISPPAGSGAIGFYDAWDWWWIGAGKVSVSQDGGVTWTPARTILVADPLPGSLQVLDSTHAWFVAGITRPVLEATDDGGTGWRMVMLPPAQDRSSHS